MKEPLIVITAFILFFSCFATPSTAQRRFADDNAPKVGEVAPTFTLKLLYEREDLPEEIDVQSFAGNQPVVLLFGSYT